MASGVMPARNVWQQQYNTTFTSTYVDTCCNEYSSAQV